jgi:hypothetical protein
LKARLAFFFCAALFAGGALSQALIEPPPAPEKQTKAEKAAAKAAEKAAAKAAAKSAATATAADSTKAQAAKTPAGAGLISEPPGSEAPDASTAIAPALAPPLAAAPVVTSTPALAPAAAPAGAATAPPPGTRWSSIDAIMQDLRVTDLAIAFFALLVAVFAYRTSSSTTKLRGLLRRQAEDNHRAVEASAQASDAARRSADAAEQTLAALRETSERQLRAYVTVRQFLQAPVKDDRQNVHGWLLQVAWQNTGATPTKGFRYWAMLREFERAVPDDFEFTPVGLKDFAGGELGSNGTVNSPPLFVSQQLIARIQDGSRKVLLLGQADYEDMLRDAKHSTRFCVELVLVNDPGGANGSPFSFSYYPQHNTIT